MSTNYGAYNYSKAAKEYISSKYNLLVDTLSIDNQEIYDYPLTNVKAWRCNVWTNDANPYPIYINQVTKEISESDTAYINAEYVKRAAKYGKLDIPLYDKLSALEDSDVVSVCVWFAQADLTDCVNCVAARYPNVKFEGDRPVTSTDTLFNDIKKSLFDEKKKVHNVLRFDPPMYFKLTHQYT